MTTGIHVIHFVSKYVLSIKPEEESQKPFIV